MYGTHLLSGFAFFESVAGLLAMTFPFFFYLLISRIFLDIYGDFQDIYVNFQDIYVNFQEIYVNFHKKTRGPENDSVLWSAILADKNS